MDDRFLQQLKKGVLELLVLETICDSSTYGYELLTKLKTRSNALFTLKEGTLYPILYRLEDDGLIESSWSAGSGRSAPKKMYTATPAGRQEQLRRCHIWRDFAATVDSFFLEGEQNNE